MNIGIISDTHDRFGSLLRAFEICTEQNIERIVHCGDWTKPEALKYIALLAAERNIHLAGVFGNRDNHALLKHANTSLPSPIQLPEDLELLHFTIGKQTIAVYHGHHKPTLRRMLQEMQYDVLLTGHTHKPLIQQTEHMLVINPGSTAFSIPRRKELRSVAVYASLAHQAKLIYFDATT